MNVDLSTAGAQILKIVDENLTSWTNATKLDETQTAIKDALNNLDAIKGLVKNVQLSLNNVVNTQKQTANVTIEFNTNAAFTGNLEGYTYNKDTNSFVSSEGVATGVEGTLISLNITNLGKNISDAVNNAFKSITEETQADETQKANLLKTINEISGIDQTALSLSYEFVNGVAKTNKTVTITITFKDTVSFTGAYENMSFENSNHTLTISLVPTGIANQIKI